VVPDEIFFVPHAGIPLPVPADPILYVPEVRFKVVAVVIVNPPSLNILLLVTSPMVKVVIVAFAKRVTPVVLLDFKVEYTYPPAVCAELPLKFTVPVLAAKVPPAVRLPPIFKAPPPVNVS